MQAFNEAYFIGCSLARWSEHIGLRPVEVDLAVGLRPGSWPLSEAERRSWRPDIAQEGRAGQLSEICGLVADLMGDDATDWLRRPDLTLQGRTPLQAMILDKSNMRRIRDRLRYSM